MDPRQRILNEVAYEAVIDAGYNPGELSGSKTGNEKLTHFFEVV